MQSVPNNNLLPASMYNAQAVTGWTDHYRSAVLGCLQSDDYLVQEDFWTTVETDDCTRSTELAAEDYLYRLTSSYSPCEIYCAWDTSVQWARAVRSLTLGDVTGQASAWSPDLTLHVCYWLQEHASNGEIRQLTAQLHHPEACRVFAAGEVDVDATVCALMHLVAPADLAAAWSTVQSGPLTSGCV